MKLRLSETKQAEETVVIFTCNTCPYSQAYEPVLVEMAQEFAEKPVSFVLINSNSVEVQPGDSYDAMVQRAKDKKFPFAYLHDETQEVATAYGAERTPEVFCFDGDLKLRYHGAPDDNYDETLADVPYLRNALDAVLAGQEPPVAETPAVGCTIKWK